MSCYNEHKRLFLGVVYLHDLTLLQEVLILTDHQLHGTLRSYLRWPLLLGVLLLIMNIQVYTMNIKIGLVMTAYVVLYLVIAILLYFFKRGALLHDLVEYSMSFHATINQVILDLDVPLAFVGPDMHCIWQNKEFRNTFSSGLKKNFLITDAIQDLTQETVTNNGELHFQIEDVFYRALIQCIDLEQAPGQLQDNAADMGITSKIYILFIYDETDLVHCIRLNDEQKLEVGLLYIDNYEESLGNVDEVRRSLLAALIDRKINKYMLRYDAITKKLDKDKYIFLFQHKYLEKMQEDKFSILEEVHTIGAAEDAVVTISIGIADRMDSYQKGQEFARSAIDMALARGGDQVVVKSKDGVLFYGGKSIQQEKSTRVKARVKAHALRESIAAADKVIIMGHSLPDADAIGSAIGIRCICNSLGKESRIVVNTVTSSTAPLLERFKDDKDYPEDLFLNEESATEFIGNGNGVLLIVVDVNRPSYTDAPSIIPLVSSIVVIDHHRQTEEYFETATLSYVEPFASSTCEMVAELMQYTGNEVHIHPLEAEALYAGIMVDTNNFMNKPGVRTFEAVAYLRRCGADVLRIRKMFRTDINEYRVRAEAIAGMEVFLNSYAITTCQAETCPSPTIVAAKVADDLLDIDGIKASFVLTAFNGKIYISARSIDELNVQLVMEKLGGGGHISSAGAQLADCSIEDAAVKLKHELITMKREGDIE